MTTATTSMLSSNIASFGYIAPVCPGCGVTFLSEFAGYLVCSPALQITKRTSVGPAEFLQDYISSENLLKFCNTFVVFVRSFTFARANIVRCFCCFANMRSMLEIFIFILFKVFS